MCRGVGPNLCRENGSKSLWGAGPNMCRGVGPNLCRENGSKSLWGAGPNMCRENGSKEIVSDVVSYIRNRNEKIEN